MLLAPMFSKDTRGPLLLVVVTETFRVTRKRPNQAEAMPAEYSVLVGGGRLTASWTSPGSQNEATEDLYSKPLIIKIRHWHTHSLAALHCVGVPVAPGLPQQAEFDASFKGKALVSHDEVESSIERRCEIKARVLLAVFPKLVQRIGVSPRRIDRRAVRSPSSMRRLRLLESHELIPLSRLAGGAAVIGNRPSPQKIPGATRQFSILQERLHDQRS